MRLLRFAPAKNTRRATTQTRKGHSTMIALFRVTTTKTTVEVTAHSFGAAASIACNIEGCPERSIVKIELIKVLD